MIKKCKIENCRGCHYQVKKNKTMNKYDIIMLVFGLSWLAFIIGWLASGRIIIG